MLRTIPIVFALPSRAFAASMKFICGEPMKAGDERLAGRLVELHRRADLLDPAGIQHDDLVGKRHRLDLIVGHVDHRRLEAAVKGGQSRAAWLTPARVEVRQAARRKGRASARARSRGRSPRADAGAKARRTAGEIGFEGQHAGRLATFLRSPPSAHRLLQPEAILSLTVRCG